MPNMNIQIGQQVRVKIDGELTTGIYRGDHPKYLMPNVEVNGKLIPRKVYEVLPLNGALENNGTTGTTGTTVDQILDEAGETGAVHVERRHFDINKRFTFLEKMVRMVAAGQSTSLVIAGQGGLGKSYTVFQQLRTVLAMEEDYDYVTVKGFSTPKSLYRVLYENRDKVIVFDDCDSVLTNDTARNILKAALDSSPVRTVSWLTERGGGEGDDSIPNKFDFIGKVIFISNLQLAKIPQALLSRALYVDVTMTSDEKIERIANIAPNLKPELDMTAKAEVIDFLRDLKTVISDLNIRTFLKVCELRIAEPSDWRDIAEYVVCSEL